MKNSAQLTGPSMRPPGYGGSTSPQNTATATSSPSKPHSMLSSTWPRPRSNAALHAPGASTETEKTRSPAADIAKAAQQLMWLEQEAATGKSRRQSKAVPLLAEMGPAPRANYKQLQEAVPTLQEKVRKSRVKLRHADRNVEALERTLNDRQAAVLSQEKALKEAMAEEKVAKDVEQTHETYEADLKQRRQALQAQIEDSLGDLEWAQAETKEAEAYHSFVQDFNAANDNLDAQIEIAQKWLTLVLAKAICTDTSFEARRSDPTKELACKCLDDFFEPPSTSTAPKIDHLLNILADPVVTNHTPDGKPGCADTLQNSIARMAALQIRAGPTSKSYGIRALLANTLNAQIGAEAPLKIALGRWRDANKSRLRSQLTSVQMPLNELTPLQAGYTVLLRLSKGLEERPGMLNAAVAVKVNAFQTLMQNPPVIAKFKAVEAGVEADIAKNRFEIKQIGDQLASIPTPTAEPDPSGRLKIKLDQLKLDLHIALGTSAKTITAYASALEEHAKLVDSLTRAKAALEDFRQDQVDARGSKQRVREEDAAFRAQKLAEQDAEWQRILPELDRAFTQDALKRAIDRHLDMDAQKLEQRLKPELTRAAAYSTRGSFLMAVADALTVAERRDDVVADQEMLVGHDRQIGLGLRKNGSLPAEEAPSHATMFRLDDRGRIAHIYPWIPHIAKGSHP